MKLNIILKICIISLLSVFNVLVIQPDKEHYVIVWDKDMSIMIYGSEEEIIVNTNKYSYFVGDSTEVSNKIKELTHE